MFKPCQPEPFKLFDVFAHIEGDVFIVSYLNCLQGGLVKFFDDKLGMLRVMVGLVFDLLLADGEPKNSGARDGDATRTP